MRQQQNIERLFRSHYEAMYNLARYLLADDDEGKDVVSDVFTQLLESSAVLIPGTERAYLMQSVRHHCFNRIAHMGVRQRVARWLTDSADIVLCADTDDRLDLCPNSSTTSNRPSASRFSVCAICRGCRTRRWPRQ